MKKIKTNLLLSVFYFLLFFLWTFAVSTYDVKEIGPNNTRIGLSSLNTFVGDYVGESMELYEITDLLSVIPLLIVACFGALGLYQLIKRKSFRKVDADLVALGVFYLMTFSVFLIFEEFIVNYRPILIEGKAEASYPSSTTMLVLCVMSTALMQFKMRIKNKIVFRCAKTAILFFTVFMILARILSGVHWFSDIIGAFLFSFGLIKAYYTYILFLHY